MTRFCSLLVALTLTTILATAQTKPTEIQATANGTPIPLTDSQKLALYQANDRTNSALAEVKALPEWTEHEEAVKAQAQAEAAYQKAAAAVDGINTKLLNTVPGLHYKNAAEAQRVMLQQLFKGVDQTKWKLGPSPDFKWVAITSPAPAAPAAPAPQAKK